VPGAAHEAVRPPGHHGLVPTVTEKQRATIAELRAGGEVEGTFACSRKDRLTARNGSPYLAIELRDHSGSIPARLFRDPDFHAASFERGDLVSVSGRVERFRDELQVELRSIRKADDGTVDPADFLPVAYRDLDELEGFLEHLAREVYDQHYRALVDAFLGDGSFRAELRRAPCTRAGHHAYLGGLLEHTVAVATLAHEACALHPRLNSDLLLCAAILHDIGKTREFALGADIELSEEGALVGHLALGQQLIAARASGMPKDKLLALSHCVLGHHGPDTLPGRRFRSAEAIGLYRLNALDAGVKGALEHGVG
jgi:3'-5' exoribonuclease